MGHPAVPLVSAVFTLCMLYMAHALHYMLFVYCSSTVLLLLLFLLEAGAPWS